MCTSMISLPEFKRYHDTVFAIIDTGEPADGTNYTTIVLTHGAGANSGVYFKVFLYGPFI